MIEAGELRPESPLRKACERAKTAVAIACYPDTERDLARLIDEVLRTSNLRIAADARAVLMTLLGGDRQASRNELRKLALYAHGRGEIALDDVMNVVSDASELKLDPIVDGAFAGKLTWSKASSPRPWSPAPIRIHHLRRAASGGLAAQIGARGGRRHTGFDPPRKRLSAPAFLAQGRRRNRAAEFQRGTACHDHRPARDRRPRHAQAGLAGVSDWTAYAALDRGECEAAGSFFSLAPLLRIGVKMFLDVGIDL